MKKAIFSFIILIQISSFSFAQECMEIGVNFHDVQYWSDNENPFKDQMKQSGEFLAFYGWDWDNEVLELIPRGIDGYPNAGIPFSADLGGSIGIQDLYVRKMISSHGRLPQTELVFLYDGNGSVSLQGDVETTSESPGRIELTCVGDNNIWLVINESAAAPNHVRNFRLLAIEDEADYETNIWKQSFLDRLAPFSSVRMMDWTQTNSCSVWNWDQRTTTTYHTQNQKSGVAYEYITNLCNTQDKDLWICVPHMATPDYITTMATFFKNNLNDDVKIYVEYSNETWNSLFDQTDWIVDDFTWIDGDDYPHNELYIEAESQPYNSGLLAKRAFQLWRATYAADSLKINRVLGCRAANPWVATEKIRAVGNDGYDILSPAWYFGADNYTDFDIGADGQDVVDACRVEFYEIYAPNYFVHYDLAKQYGKEVMCYEGGQHVTANGDEDFHALQAFYDAQVHPDMYDLYDDVIDTLREVGATMLMAYTLAGGDGVYGSWGQVSDIDLIPTLENAPKYTALIDNLCENIVATDDISVEETAAFSVYPNPTTGLFTIASSHEVANITILDMTGKALFQEKVHTNHSNIDLGHLPEGIYLIRLQTGSTISTKRIVLQK